MQERINEKEFNKILKEELGKIFEGEKFEELSNFQKRKYVFYYLVNNCEYDFKLLNDIYIGREREYLKEILAVLKPENEKEGVCNSFSYAYKLLLDKIGIPSMLVACDIEKETIEDLKNNNVNTSRLKQNENGKYYIPHMLVLVQNEDGTFSFDDITYGIFNRKAQQKQKSFNYDYLTAKQNGQNNFIGLDNYMLRYLVEDSKDTSYDVMYREKFGKENDHGFLDIPIHLIKEYQEKQLKSETIDYER